MKKKRMFVILSCYSPEINKVLFINKVNIAFSNTCSSLISLIALSLMLLFLFFF